MNPVSDACLDCPIWKSGQFGPVFGRGSLEADVILIGEAPGRDEVRTGLPFSGESGRQLGDLIRSSELNKLALRVENAVLCRPVTSDGVNRQPTSEEVFCCRPHLAEALHKQKKKKAIVPLGNVALQSLRKKPRATGITQARGIPADNEEFDVLEFPTFHPANLLRSPQNITVVDTDFRQLIQLVARGRSKKSVAYGVADTYPKFQQLINGLARKKLFSFDIETGPYDENKSDGFDNRRDHILCISFSWDECVGIVVPWIQWPNTLYWGQDAPDVLITLKNLFEDSSVKKLVHNGLFDVPFLRGRWDIEVQGLKADTMLMHHILDENSNHGLKELAARNTDMGDYDKPLQDFLGQFRLKKDRHYGKVPPEILYSYAAADTDACYRLYNLFNEQISNDAGLNWEFENLIMPLEHVLDILTYKGVKIDKAQCTRLREEYAQQMGGIALRVEDLAGYPVKIKSPQQLQAFIFSFNPKNLPIKPLGFLPRKDQTTANGAPSTGKAVLLEFAERYEAAKALLANALTDIGSIEALEAKENLSKLQAVAEISEFKKLAKLDGTYVKGMMTRADENDFLHASYRIHGTVTKRLACRNPSLMNIPRKKGGVKTVFIPDSKEYVFVDADFSQAELRVMALVSREPALIDAFNNDIDVHCLVASECYGVPMEQIVANYKANGFDQMRNDAKAVNFGLIYGRSAYTLAAAFGWTREQGEAFVQKYFNRFKRVDQWMRQQKELVHKQGYVRNWFGSIRRIPNINSSDKQHAAEAERQAINAPIQGGAAQFTYLAMIRIHERFERELIDAELKLTVHDSILSQARREDAEYVAQLMKEEMERPVTNYLGQTSDVRMLAEIEIVERWGEEKKREDDTEVRVLEALDSLEDTDEEEEEDDVD